ncbi:16S rRNA (adenine(1518)-N(6)/adenine(1519)-N(6))-dimethyltransferase RsmA [Spiroplasma turonicum]|uniref:Ribosomal RNA small subunit methyltransferase A n=1 Tax=Spiroplasma turonicum TaxID=216946 RepID=A0A0K1P7Y7_9MOLU|nr:16S rRNA (adenine(1518)-N(6)/adenine(1519)-N(6))-dimethyltransferase RsmA [Spiroplasma turonicum]AKU80319.1 dimethyladenosine transferase [Spiroplasma turonicum]ALX71320.1 dimethyladenosine transferase [Spiroplasma turonicum]
MHIPKKKFGQNFITDGNLISKILSFLPKEKNQLIIEIGPGQGALTRKLTELYDKVIAIEIDKDLEIYLKDNIKAKNFELIINDVLDLDFNNLIENNPFEKVSIISNTPYYIVSPILFKCFDIHNYLSKAILMVQKEVGERICANKNTKNYNNLSVASNFFCKPKYLFSINRKLFKPIPLVDSALIELDFEINLTNQVEDKTDFINFIRLLFNNKRKTILNNLTNVLKNKDKAFSILLSSNIESNLRPENISVDEFIKIYKEVNK